MAGEARRPGTVMQQFPADPDPGQGPLAEILNQYLRAQGRPPGSGGGGRPPFPSSDPAGQGLGMQGLAPSAVPRGATAASGTDWAAMAQQYGPGIVGIIQAFMRRGSGGAGDGVVPPEVQQMLQEHLRRMQATGPLFDQLTTQAQAGLPRTS